MAGTPLGALKLAANAACLSLDEYQRRIAIGTNRCRVCGTWKPRSEFTSDPSRGDGCARKCHSCVRNPNPSKAHLFQPGAPSAFKGRTHTGETKAAIAVLHKGKQWRLGKRHTSETKSKIGAIIRERGARGERHYAYSHGRAQRINDLRRRPEYVAWRNAVFARDGYRCRDCGDDLGGNLRAHHEKPMAAHPELAFDVDNGVTLCHPCHELRHFKPDSIRNERKRKRGERLWR